MKTAIMQPYLFPYVGYFQLINAVDNFVFYDDVNFIKQGWINRNSILSSNGNSAMFTIPLSKASPNKNINEIALAINEKWLTKFYKSLEMTYKKAPCFEEVYHIIKKSFSQEHNSISNLAISSIYNVCDYLDMDKSFFVSSKSFSKTKGLDKADRLIAICKQLNSSHYINALGGKELYKKAYFDKQDIRLDFLEPSKNITYKQFHDAKFIASLSIIDVLMFNSKSQVKDMLSHFKLV